MNRLSIMGVPSSAGSYAAGQDQAPAVLRDAGLIQALNDAGFLVRDHGDAPLAENTDGRNTGPTLDQLALALLPAAGDPRLRTLSIGELNPTRSAGEPDAIPRFIRMLTATLSVAAANNG
jgi:arginase family enzyme